MTTAPFDTLKLVEALRDKAHFSQEQAEGITKAFSEAFQEEIATKQDISDFRQATQKDIADLKQATQKDISDVKHEIALLDAKFESKFQNMEAKFQNMDVKFDALGPKFDALEQRLARKIDLMTLGLATALGSLIVLVRF